MILSNYQYYSPSDISFWIHPLNDSHRYQNRPSYICAKWIILPRFSLLKSISFKADHSARWSQHDSSYRKRVQHLLLRPIIISSLRLIITYPLLRTSCFSRANCRRSADENKTKKSSGIFNYLPCSAFTIISHNNRAFESRGIRGFFAGKFALMRSRILYYSHVGEFSLLQIPT